MGLIDSSFDLNNLEKILILYNSNYNDNKNKFVYIDSSNEKTTLYYYKLVDSDYHSTRVIFQVMFEKELSFYKDYQIDSTFVRANSNQMNFAFNNQFFFDMNEKYYVYVKKLYGKSNFYLNKQKMDSLTDLSEFTKPIESYDNTNEYELINNKVIMVTGYQLLSFLISYNTLFDVYFQAFDVYNIKINQYLYHFNNIVKLLHQEKVYLLDFKVDHLIKLDDNFLDTIVNFYDEKGNIINTLDKSNRVITNLNGNNIKVRATQKDAFIYFYQKISNDLELKVIEFDKNQNGKNMKFTIKTKNNEPIKIEIIKDFGFTGYYPMLNREANDRIETQTSQTTIYIENVYDKLEYNLYKDEKYLIYILDSYQESFPKINLNNYEIGSLEYTDNLITKGNKYNFEIIPKNTKGSLILNAKIKKLNLL